MTDKIKEAVLKSNMPDGVYETYSDKETGWFMKAMHEYASLVSASKDEEIARLKEDVKELVGGLVNLLEQYHYECEHHAKSVGMKVDDWVSDLETYQNSKQLIQKHKL